jgi:hypothetical protein
MARHRVSGEDLALEALDRRGADASVGEHLPATDSASGSSYPSYL